MFYWSATPEASVSRIHATKHEQNYISSLDACISRKIFLKHYQFLLLNTLFHCYCWFCSLENIVIRTSTLICLSTPDGESCVPSSVSGTLRVLEGKGAVIMEGQLYNRPNKFCSFLIPPGEHSNHIQPATENCARRSESIMRTRTITALNLQYSKNKNKFYPIFC